MTTPKPTAQGTLAKTPFPHLLLYTHGRQLSGTLAVWPDSDQDKAAGQDRVLFQAGSVVAIRPMGQTEHALAALLRLFRRRDAAYGFYEGQNLLGASQGVLVEKFDTYTLLARGSRQEPREDLMDTVLGRLSGRALRIRAGVPLDRLEFGPKERAFIDTLRAGPATLQELLACTELEPLDAKRVIYLLALIRGVEAADGQSVPPPAPVESTPAPGDRMPRHTLGDPNAAQARLPRHTLGDPNAAQARLPRHTLGEPNASAVLPSPRAPATAPTSASASGAGRAAPRPAPDAQTSGKAPSAPANLQPQDLARWHELAQIYDRLDELNHYDLLRVTRETPASEVSSAYFALVKKFHPDRLPESLAPLAQCAQLVFERITEANETLANADMRAEYDKAVAAGGGTRSAERMMRAVLESALEFQKAEVLAKRRDYEQAMELIQSALAKNPDEGDYHALHGWLLHLMNPGDAGPTDQMLREFDFALKANPKSERAHYYKGVVLKRLNRLGEAARHFRQASEINPRNVEAAREVRLSNMRKDSKPPAGVAGSGRLLSKLFKGGKDS